MRPLLISTPRAALLVLHLICVVVFTWDWTPVAARELPVVAPILKCDQLSGIALRAGALPLRINSAKTGGEETSMPFCRVQGYVAPQIKFELKLPIGSWRQRLLYIGCGGFCGSVSMASPAATEGCAPLGQGSFATVASNLGHDAAITDGLWAAGNPAGLADFGERGAHAVTLAAKAIIARFYGQSPRYAYFAGCSDGGREAMMEAQRHPGDFNGIIAGAPVINVTANNSVYHAWIAQHLLNDASASIFSYAALGTLHRAVMQACDALDGQRDGLIAAGGSCRFSPKSIACASDAPPDNCLTAAQVQAAEALYDGPRDTKGRALYFGFPFGSEYSWIEQAHSSVTFATSFISYMSAFGQDRELNVQKLDFSPASVAAYQSAAPVLNALDPDLSGFAKAGGKLIIWHGETDVGVPPGSTLDYAHKVRSTLGDRVTDNMLRLYMVPGVNHCGGGEGPDGFDMLTPLMAWVEDGVAPKQIDAANRKKPTQRWNLLPFARGARISAQPAS